MYAMMYLVFLCKSINECTFFVTNYKLWAKQTFSLSTNIESTSRKMQSKKMVRMVFCFWAQKNGNRNDINCHSLVAFWWYETVLSSHFVCAIDVKKWEEKKTMNIKIKYKIHKIITVMALINDFQIKLFALWTYPWGSQPYCSIYFWLACCSARKLSF